ncbi:hypothetical protein [Acaryochloris sp. CCMEE 5410]|uniref:hypothetical protein n=1 Tax=Acaryochloris sp. CCMEE 5410 TaxID=310037 RepID=UPI0002484476|nr:hypothetical protein [Acaryochloris sp. CCMEE 5410]KAI9134006.1 hypothetical protein ON05_012415 [Acaryochloris sp. CCMEE 5410]
MKLQEIKVEVFRLTGVPRTPELKRQRPVLTYGRDLRYKAEWLAILDLLKHQQTIQPDITLNQLDQQDIELQQSLHRVGRVTGLSAEAVDKIWKGIQHNSQANSIDITLEELEV